MHAAHSAPLTRRSPRYCLTRAGENGPSIGSGARIDLDAEDREAPRCKPPRDLAGAGAHVERVGASERGELVEQRVGERGAAEVVLLGGRAEGLGPRAIEVELGDGHAATLRGGLADGKGPALASAAGVAARRRPRYDAPEATVTRFFNTAGVCKPDIHFLLPPARRLPEVRGLVDRQSYFVLHAPRQSGKTTALLTLAAELTAEGRYAAALVSAEEGAPFGNDPGAAEGALLSSFQDYLRGRLPPDLQPPPWPAAEPGHRLGAALSAWAKACPRPLVLFIDEIDALRDDALLSVLRQLRAGHPNRPQAFPASIALVGLRDVRDYKIASGGSSRLGTPSPFNILVKSLTLRAFTHDEVAELYAQHTAETGQAFEPAAIDRAFDLTRGQPWLVNALAAAVVDELVPDRAIAVTARHVDQAKERLILSRVTHLDSLADKLGEDRVRRVVEPVLAGREVGVEVPRDDIDYVTDLGLIARDAAGNLVIANPIYREVIPRELAAVTADVMVLPARTYRLPDGRLDVNGLFDAFVAFWRQHAEPMVRGQSYPEIAPHIVLTAYLQRVVNGGGMIEREYAAGSGRMDLCIRWPVAGGEQRVAIELKVWREKQADPLHEGLAQLEGYLGRLGLKEGFLVIFDRRRAAEDVPWDERPRWEQEELAGGRQVRVLRL